MTTFEHVLEEPSLTHSNDFDDSEEVLCADVAEECACLFREDELEDNRDELRLDQRLDSWCLLQWRTDLMSFTFSFPTLTVTPRPGLITWPCGPLTFSFWFRLSCWLPLLLPLSFVLIHILRTTLALWLSFWLLWFALPLFAYLIHWILHWDLARDVELIDLLWVWGHAVVEVVDEKGVNPIPRWLLIDAEGKSIGKRPTTNMLKCQCDFSAWSNLLWAEWVILADQFEPVMIHVKDIGWFSWIPLCGSHDLLEKRDLLSLSWPCIGDSHVYPDFESSD